MPPLNEGRPGRAGNCVHAAERRRRRPVARSTKAGLAGPATDGNRSAGEEWVTALNEGRPGRAGNWRRGGRERLLRIQRSTKAGLAGPATGAIRNIWFLAPLIRSTKAGLAGPATAGQTARSRAPRQRSLNEGRPGRAGNWRIVRFTATSPTCSLNEGRPGRAGNCSGS